MFEAFEFIFKGFEHTFGGFELTFQGFELTFQGLKYKTQRGVLRMMVECEGMGNGLFNVES